MRNGDLYDANGRFVRTLGDDEENYVVKDGESVRVPLSMMDSVQRDIMQHALTPREPMRAPGYVQISDGDYDERERRFFDHKQRLSDAWKHAPALDASRQAAKPYVPSALNPADARDAALDKRDAELTEAWRHP